ncbi:MAG: carbon-nitrogen hydrolase family protein [candidate division Zixibacteria bacterium]|nr:carbon-nitrogen hydrolase family protein [candidate division Zixibacteria bacterium]MDH3938906.1 carbon-nitrogen hydrolase family protein [candidate division Zixibacteria bacterium]MDH4032753.1 carbon-nitrogen hydrolase family protein [candidate division Zixibacteria bacterium]
MSSTPTPFKVAAVQASPVFLNKEASVEKACQLIVEVGKNGASLAVFPEAFISGYPDWVWVLPAGNKAAISDLYADFLASAVTIPDESTAQLCKAAKSAGIYVAIGINERNSADSNSSVYNTILYLSPSGEIMGRHRKLIPTGGERLMWAPGDGSTLVSFDTSLGKLGGLICWENFMPLPRMAMYQAGVQLYVAPTWDQSEAWQVAMRHIAREGGMYVISVAPGMHKDDIPDKYDYKNLYPEDKVWVNQGNSLIVDPTGAIIAGPANSVAEILYAEVDLSTIPTQKWMFDVAGHYSRPDVFDFGVKG